MQWKIFAGAMLLSILLLLYIFGRSLLLDSALFLILPSLVFAVLYGLLSGDIKLSALFGFLFLLAYFMAFLLHSIHNPIVLIPSAMYYLLILELTTTLLGAIAAWIGRKIQVKLLELPSIQEKVPTGVLIVVILLWFYTNAATEGGLWFSLIILFTVFYGVLSGDLILSALFGILFLVASVMAFSLFEHNTPISATIPFILIWGLGFALLGAIASDIGRRASLE